MMKSRRQSRKILLGSVAIGGDAPVSVQTMTNVPLADAGRTLDQMIRCAEVGCDIIRVAVDDAPDEKALYEVVRNSPLPVVADIQFHAESAIEAMKAGAAGVRLNPGIIRDEEILRPIAEMAAATGTVIRVGANGGSLNRQELEKALAQNGDHEETIADLLVSNALRQCEALEKFGVRAVKVALKSSSIPVTLAAYRKFAACTDYPLHIGLTESGVPERGLIKSAYALGTLLAGGIGDTLRVSLSAPPEEEVLAGRRILECCGLRHDSPEVVACPTCGRTEFDLFSLVRRVEDLVQEVERTGQRIKLRKLAVMGCPVNGPGEARDADLGMAGSRNGKVTLFRFGKPVGVYDAEEGFEVFKAELISNAE